MTTPLRIYRPPEREGLTRLASFGLHLYIPDALSEAAADDLGVKSYETRSWQMSHRGLLAIHAAKRRSDRRLHRLAVPLRQERRRRQASPQVHLQQAGPGGPASPGPRPLPGREGDALQRRRDLALE